jgi:hypothetical protein
MLSKIEAQERTLADQFKEAKRAAESRERLLLTGTGDALKDTVRACLVDFGFEVRDMDTVYPQGDRREDLQVIDPDTPEWVALVEVRGYTNGARVNDLPRLGRFRNRYFRDHGQDPSAAWYVVNQFIGDDPQTRQPILASNESELESFAQEEAGLAIDTAELFQLWMAVKEGGIPTTQARANLMTAVGRFVFRPETPGQEQRSA